MIQHQDFRVHSVHEILYFRVHDVHETSATTSRPSARMADGNDVSGFNQHEALRSMDLRALERANTEWASRGDLPINMRYVFFWILPCCTICVVHQMKEAIVSDAMVTGRMSEQKKLAGNRILAREHMRPSQAINLMYQRLIDEKSARFLKEDVAAVLEPTRFKEALSFVDGLSVPRTSDFDLMTDAEVKSHRLAAKGLM